MDIIKLIVLGLFAFAGSTISAYWWWTKVREIRLRENLFTIRDNFFDLACKNNWLDDPAYVATRGLLNNLIGFAHNISFSVINYLANTEGLPEVEHPTTNNALLTKEIDRVNREIAEVISSYVLKDNLLGRVAVLVVRLSSLSDLAAETRTRSRRVIEPDIISSLPSGLTAKHGLAL